MRDEGDRSIRRRRPRVCRRSQELSSPASTSYAASPLAHRSAPPLPEDFSCCLVEAIDLERVLREIVHRFDVAIEAGPERAVAGGADRGRHENAIAPDNRTRRRDPRNRSFPLDVLSGRDVPLGERSLAVTATGGVLAAERGPVSRGGAGRRIETDGRRARGCRGGRCGAALSVRRTCDDTRPGSVTVTDSTNPLAR